MKIHRGNINYSALQGHVVTIGTFDGVHRAHRTIIDSVVELAQSKGCESILITFEPHPRSVIYPKDNTLRLLTDLEEKLSLLEETALDHVVVFPFTAEFSQQPPEEYIEGFLLGKFKPQGIVVGFDHRFGVNRQGNYLMLKEYADRYDIDLREISKRESNHVKISSTAIREHILNGDIRSANRLLGYRYYLTGDVIKGDSVGTSLGYPTANLRLQSKHKLVPKSGIYAAFVRIQDLQYDGLLYIGQKPSLSDSENVYIEVNLRNFEGYLYGEKIQIELVDFIRNDEKFKDIEALKTKIKEDESRIIHILDAEKNDSV